ncbi:MAG: bacterial Ig-like domain-containing protein, partial [Oscillospiraceae bacterium]|nr:bacterial Ig-like domain-containing protein [Oscillospiraceae bacterium]
LYYYSKTHEDLTPPVFHCEAESIELSVTDPPEVMLQGLSATDDRDGDISSDIRVIAVSPFNQETGDFSFTVTYIVFDHASNYAQFSRTARYTDYASPRFHLSSPMSFYVNDTIRFDGTVTVTDLLEGDISGRMKLDQSSVINTVPGAYKVQISATNRMDDEVTLPLTVQILSNSHTRPVIELKDYLIYLERGEIPSFPSYIQSVSDPMKSGSDKTVPNSEVSVNDSAVDSSQPGTYEVYYHYTGTSGEIATVILTVVVE